MADRYDGWHHKRGLDKASPGDLAAAKSVLGALQNDMKLGNLPSGFRRQALPNGTIIEASITMGVPSVNIMPPRGGTRTIPARELGEIITVPRSAAQPDGVDEDQPEVMLRHGPDFWRTYFYGSSPAGFSGEGGSFSDMFPKGLGQGGNADWVGPDGERLTWYGPSSRAFADGYVHPRCQSGKQVFYLGEALLDTDEYVAGSELDPGMPDRYIVGAALKRSDEGWWLYTVQSFGLDGETPTPPVGSADLKGFFTYPLAEQPSEGGLHRYRLYRWLDPQGVVRFNVVRNSREFLLLASTNGPDPWFFNKDCSEAICHLALTNTNAPGKPWWAASLPARDNPPDVHDSVFTGIYHPPGSAGLRFRVAFDVTGALSSTEVLNNLSVTSGGPAAAVTGDYDLETGELVTYGIRLDASLVPYFTFDGSEALLYESTVDGPVVGGTKRWVLYASPRDHLVVLLRANVEFNDTVLEQYDYWIEVYREGVLLHEEQISDVDASMAGLSQRWGDSTDFLDGLEGQAVTPQWFIYGLLIYYKNTATTPGDNTTWRSDGHYIGANPMFAQLPYPAECWFGIADPAIAIGEPADLVSSFVGAGFNGSVPDDNGNFSVTGAARDREAVLVSCWTPTTGMARSFTYITDNTLVALTGVGGTNSRFHPVRTLGKMPVEDRVEKSPDE